MKVVGLAGLTGSGKTKAAQVFIRKGAYVIDADKVGHNVILRGEPAYADILNAFGNYILRPDCEIDRAILGHIVFSDPQKLILLNKLTHKHIIDEILKAVSDIKDNPGPHRAIVIDAALLVESGLCEICDTTVAIISHKAARLKRIIERDNITADAALRRIASQTDTAADIFDYVLDNNGDINEFERKVERLADMLILGGNDIC